MSETYDVVVIGGGPAGSTVACFLAKAGRRVLLLERERFPRYHIGESLLSGTTGLLKALGVLDKVEAAGYVKKHGVTWIWGVERTPWTVYFKDALATKFDFGYQVERGPFDKMLLDNAREHGVTVLEQATVIDVLSDTDRVGGVSYRTADGQEHSTHAPWTVDASGQTNVVTKRMAQKQWDERLRNMALWSYWRGARRDAGADGGNTFLPTFADGWWWFIPLRNDRTSIGVVLDRQSYAAAKAQGLEAFYAGAIQRTPELAERLAAAERVDGMHVTMDWSYTHDRFYGHGFVAAGDAACFIDPLLSTGVHLAILSGYLCAAALNTVLDQPEGEERLLAFYQQEYRREFHRLKDQIYFLYGGHRSPDSYFWHARKTMDLVTANPRQAFVSLIAGAFEHRSWYRRFLDHLDVPESLRQLATSIFNGQATGRDLVGPDEPLIRNPSWTRQASFAVKGLRLEAAEILTNGDGRTLPLHEPLAMAWDRLDGRVTLNDIVSTSSDDADARAALWSALNEAITHQAVIAARASTTVA